MSLIVIEGMDGTGKTTLANNIIKQFPQFEYRKPVPSEGPTGSMTGDFMTDQMIKMFDEVQHGKNIITDRINLISEPIYGPICRGTSRLSQKQVDLLLPEFCGVNPIIIFCRPHINTVLKNVNGDNLQMDGVSKFAERLYIEYDSLILDWLQGRVPVRTYNYEIPTEDYSICCYIR